ncbi:MAG TPA: RDD family protein [Acidimicrobiales bacterium]|nr:RDD family protein [Acidimicrobiales bacterium]
MTPRRLGPLERLPQAVAEQVVRRIIELIDVDEIIRQVDVNAIVQRVDLNALMANVDVDAIIARVDANEIVDRIDIDRIVARIDVNAIADKIDIDAIVAKANLGEIVAQSTTGMLGEFLGFLRREVVSLDDLLDTVTLFKRRTEGRPKRPPQSAPPPSGSTREGQYAGGVTRLLAFLADIGAIWGLFLLLSAGVEQAVKLFSGNSYNVESHRLVGIIAVVVWGFLYFTVQWTLSGRTIGMAILGAHVVTSEGHAIKGRAANIRTLVLPFSIAFWFLCLVEIEVRADRRTLHDLAAGTCVVYHWQARGASLPWLRRPDD